MILFYCLHNRYRLPSRWFFNCIFMYAVRVYVNDHHWRTMVYHYIRHPSESTTQVGRFRQYNGRRLVVFRCYGRVATDGH